MTRPVPRVRMHGRLASHVGHGHVVLLLAPFACYARPVFACEGSTWCKATRSARVMRSKQRVQEATLRDRDLRAKQVDRAS